MFGTKKYSVTAMPFSGAMASVVTTPIEATPDELALPRLIHVADLAGDESDTSSSAKSCDCAVWLTSLLGPTR